MLTNDICVGEKLYINGNDAFLTYNADLIDLALLARQMSTRYLDYANTSSLLRWGSQPTAKPLQVQFYVGGATEDEAQINVSRLVADCQDCVITKENSAMHYHAILTEYSTEKTEVEQYIHVTLNFVATQTLPEQIHTFTTSGNYFNAGNVASGVVLTILPKANISSANICGIIVKNLKTNVPFIIDGIRKKVTSLNINRYGDTDMTDFPTSVPGTNYVQLSANIHLTLEYYPTFL